MSNAGDEYRTEDLDKAAYLTAKGQTLLNIERNVSGRCVFVFGNPARAEELSGEFIISECAAYAHARRELTYRLHRV